MGQGDAYVAAKQAVKDEKRKKTHKIRQQKANISKEEDNDATDLTPTPGAEEEVDGETQLHPQTHLSHAEDTRSSWRG